MNSSVSNSVIDKLRSQWSQYNQPNSKSLLQPRRPKLPWTPTQKKEHNPQLIQNRDFHYKCHHCHEPIFYSQYWFDDFQNRYIPLSSYTHRPHKCYQKEEEKEQGLMNGTYLTMSVYPLF